MEVLKETIDRAIEKIESTSDLFYQQRSQEGYKELKNTIDDLLAIAEGLKEINAYSEGIDFKVERFLEVLSEALSALEQKDTVLLSDILQYDLIEHLSYMKEQFM